MLMKLNYGSGETKLAGFINIDSIESTKPDILADLKKGPLPFKDESAELIHMLHALEHIEQGFWPLIFHEFHRLLIEDGELRLAYPEFEVCARNFIENYKGNRIFWRRTLYGRQLYPGDYHIVPMVTSEVINELTQAGFRDIKSGPEPGEPFNTFLIAHKGQKPMTRADI